MDVKEPNECCFAGESLEFIENKGTQWIDTGYVKNKNYVATKRYIDPSDFARRHNASVDKDNRITMEILCDGTLLFLLEMLYVLKEIGCTGIEYDGKKVIEGIPEEKPWCNYLYTASGVLPDEITYFNGILCKRKEN